MLAEKKTTEKKSGGLMAYLRRAGTGAALTGICLAALLCEIFVFNYKHWDSLPHEQVRDIDYQFYGLAAAGDSLEIEEAEAVIELSGIHEPVAYLAFNLEPGQQASLTVAAVDEASCAWLSAPACTVRGDVPRSQYLRLHFSGDVERLRVTIRGMQGERIRQPAVTVNAAVPLFFSWQRCLMLAAGLCCLYVLRPGSSCYRLQADLTERRQWLATAVCIAVQLLFFARMLQWNTGALAWPEYMEHHQQYYRLTEALLEGHVDVGEAPLLSELDNPYDPAARAAAGIGYEDFRWDQAYYNGRYYVYFGVAPVLLFYLPYYVLTGAHLPHARLILALGGLLMAGAAFLLWQMIRRWFPRTPYILYLLLTVIMGAISGLGYAVYKPDLYLVPILTGVVCGIWGLGFWISARSGEGCRLWRLVAGSLCVALIAGCRPQLLLILAMGVILSGREALRDKKQALALGIPLAAVAAGVMWYNAARFGSVWDFGANYNLTTNDMTHRGWVWGRCGLGIFSYLLQPVRISSVFPFLQDFRVETSYQGLTLSEMMVGGVLWLFPVLCFGVYGLGKRKVFADRRCYALVAASQLLTVALVVVDTQMAGLLTRYFVDFVWIAMTGSCLTILACYDRAVGQQEKCRRLLRLVVMAGSITLALVFLRIFAHSEDSIQSANPALYYEIRSLIAFWM